MDDEIIKEVILKSPSPPATCSTCADWCDFAQFYVDPEEPDDYGHCQSDDQKSGDEVTARDDTCEALKPHPSLDETPKKQAHWSS